MSAETKDKLTPGEEGRILELTRILRSAYIEKEDRPLPPTEGKETIAEVFQDLLKEKLPGQKLRGEMSKEIERWKRGKDSKIYSTKEIARYVKKDIENAAKLYIDGSRHIQMYNRQYIEDKLENEIEEVIGGENIRIDDLYRIAKIAFDLNGLKTLNDSAGHEAGNHALEIFSKILKDGQTTRWLKDQEVEVIPAHQSGDEFLLLMYYKEDLSPILEETKKRYEEEINSFGASHLLDFGTARTYLNGLKIYDKFLGDLSTKENIDIEKLEDKLSKEFKFRLGTGIGIVTLGEALAEIDPEKIRGKSYKIMSRSALGRMFKIADEKAIEHKKRTKAALTESDPLLAILYNRNVAGSDKDNTEERANLLLKNSELEVEVARLQNKVALLEKSKQE